MNNTARIQASFSLPDVLLEDKIERIGNNQTKMINTKKRSRVIDSNAIVYAGQVWLCAVSRRALRIGVVVGRFYSKIFSSFTYRARLSASFKLWSLTFMPKSLCFRVKITTKLSQKSFPPTNTISVSPFLFTTR